MTAVGDVALARFRVDQDLAGQTVDVYHKVTDPGTAQDVDSGVVALFAPSSDVAGGTREGQQPGSWTFAVADLTRTPTRGMGIDDGANTWSVVDVEDPKNGLVTCTAQYGQLP